MIDDPDYARAFTMARCIAWSYGWCIVQHGTLMSNDNQGRKPMIATKLGELHWVHGKLNLNGWEFDGEDEHYTENGLKRATAMCAIECMLDNVGVNFGDETMPFDVQRLAMDVIFAAAVTSSPAMMRELAPKWWHRLAWWKR